MSKTKPKLVKHLTDVEPTKLTVDMREWPDNAGYMHLRQAMLSLDEGDENVGAVETGAGLGSDVIYLRWKGRVAVVRGRDMLRAYAETIDPEGAKRIPT